jgi:hypothetical protein
VQSLSTQPGRGARFSGDGTRVAWYRPRRLAGITPADLVIFDLRDGSERVLEEGGCPAWSLDGNSVLAVPFRGPLRRVYLDGTRSKPIPDAGHRCALPLPGGRLVLFEQDDRLVMLDGARRRTLLEMPGCGIGPVDFDPRTRRLAMTTTCPKRHDSGLFVLDLDDPGHPPRAVIRGHAYGAAWSPDGHWLATALRTDDRGYLLTLVTPDGAHRRTIPGGIANNPDWAPGCSCTARLGRGARG